MLSAASSSSAVRLRSSHANHHPLEEGMDGAEDKSGSGSSSPGRGMSPSRGGVSSSYVDDMMEAGGGGATHSLLLDKRKGGTGGHGSKGGGGGGGGLLLLLSKDAGSMALLLVLYTLQGIPMGLSGSIPFLLTDKVSYRQQALFSLVSLPFSFKLLWAPLVDSTSFPSWGRRKSWLVPVQTLCGLLMLAASPLMPYWMGDRPSSSSSSPPPAEESGGGVPNVRALTAYFLSLYALMATQDIAVDGWALTMLSTENVGHASTCNTIGQTLGYFLAHVGFLALNSAETCNRFLRSTPQPYGMVSLSGFMWFWGWVFLATTFLVLCKAERRATRHQDHDDDDYGEVGGDGLGGPAVMGNGWQAVLSTYRQLFQILRLPAVRSMCLVLMTVKISFAVIDSATNLKLIEYGMPKEEIALLSPLLVAAGIFIPLVLTPYTSGPRPLDIFLHSYIPRLLVGLLYGLLLPLCAWAYRVPGLAPTSFRLYFLLCVGLRELTANAMFVSQMAFFARVSDPRLGGTYMTLLNTVSNLGGSWVKTTSLSMLDPATIRDCRQPPQQHHGQSPSYSIPLLAPGGGDGSGSSLLLTCSSPEGQTLCRSMGGECVTLLDGFTVQLVACTVLGLLWYALMKRRILRLQDTRPEEWQVAAVNKRAT